MHHWVQFKSNEVDMLKVNKKIPMKIKPSHEWIEDGIRFCEFHADYANYFFKYGHKNLKFGGNLSVRRDMNKKSLMSWGQDEVNFSHFVDIFL